MIANARMYTVDAGTSALWRTLFEWVLERAQLSWGVIDYPAPLPLSKLWSRADLGAVLMCGLPYMLRDPTPQLIAAPIPSSPRYGGQPIYFTDLAVRADSPFTRIEDTFGGVVGYTVTDSQSGYFAFRHFLRGYHDARGGTALYRDVVGGLINARGVIEALTAGRIDVGPLDSFSHDLLKRHQPDLAAHVKIVASTGPTPIPAFVATGSIDENELLQLRNAFVDAGADGALTDLRDQLLVSGFALPQPEAYAMLRTRRNALIAAPEVW